MSYVDVRLAFVRWLHKSLFVIILLLLLLSSLEVLTTCLTDAFPKFLSNKRILVTGPTCLVLYLLGLPCVSRVGLVYLLVPLPLMSASSLSVVCGCVCANRQEYTGWLSSTSLSPAGCCCFWRSLRSSASATFTVRPTFWEMLGARAAAVMGSHRAFAGGNRFIKDIEMMLGTKSCTFWLWWRACWFCISPCIIVVSTTPTTCVMSREFCGDK